MKWTPSRRRGPFFCGLRHGSKQQRNILSSMVSQGLSPINREISNLLMSILIYCIVCMWWKGFVTDHSTLLQEHSQLYHHLSLFETETKRKLAMESRRIEMLSPLLAQLNKASYEVLHKQVPCTMCAPSLVWMPVPEYKLFFIFPNTQLYAVRYPMSWVNLRLRCWK